MTININLNDQYAILKQKQELAAKLEREILIQKNINKTSSFDTQNLAKTTPAEAIQIPDKGNSIRAPAEPPKSKPVSQV